MRRWVYQVDPPLAPPSPLSTPLPTISAPRDTNYPIMLEIDGEEVGGWVEWGMSFEEVLGGIGRATLTIQDRTNTWDLTAHQWVKATHRSSGWIFYQGETLTPALTIPVGMPWRRWTADCRDLNAGFDERIVGAPNGSVYDTDPTSGKIVFIDQRAVSQGTDAATFQVWVSDYLSYARVGFDLSTYVFMHVPNGFIGRPENVMHKETALTTLRSVLDELASMADTNVQYWFWPDGHGIWAAIPRWQDLNVSGGGTSDMPDAPLSIVGLGGPTPDFVTTIPHMGISITKDGGSQPEAIYINGKTTYAFGFLSDGTPTGVIDPGGSGWYPFVPDASRRQAVLSAPISLTKTAHDRIGANALLRTSDPVLHMTLNIMTDQVGLRTGMNLPVQDDLLPNDMVGKKFPIQSIKTTIVPTTDLLMYELTVGDGPDGRESSYNPARTAAEQEVITQQLAQPVLEYLVELSADQLAYPYTASVLITPISMFGGAIDMQGVSATLTVESSFTQDFATVFTTHGVCTPSTVDFSFDGLGHSNLAPDPTTPNLFYRVVAQTNV